MTAEIKLPPFPEGLCLREDIEDYARAAVEADRAQRAPEYLISACYFPGHDEVELTWERKSAGAKAALTCKVTPEQGKQIANVVWPCVYHEAAPQLAVSPSLLSDIRELAAYAEGSKSPRMVRASRAASAWLEGAQPAVPDEPNWQHPKIQGLIGSEARLRITIDLIWKILEDPNQEFTASDMEYWDTIHDKLKEALSTEPAQQPLTDEKCDAIYRALDTWARGFDEYEFGLPQVCGGGGEGGREVIRHALRNRSQE